MYWKELIALLAAYVIAEFLGPFVIPLMVKLKVGQTERDNAVESHLAKNGTPTIGGVIFLLPVIIIAVIMAIIMKNNNLFVLAVVTFCFGAVGFIDDYIKVVKHCKDGLKPWQKMGALFVVSVLFALYMQFVVKNGNTIGFYFLGKNHMINLSWLYIPFVIFVLLAMTNAVNLTDGLDGLCSGVSAIVFLVLSVAAIVIFNMREVSVFSTCFIGALIGFMTFNHFPAKIFMGDTGSLAIGGALGAAAIIMNHPIMLVSAGLLFVFEALSVILQVSYFKISHGKRIFKCAPLHHHFEKCGWKETKVTWVFWTFTAICCIATYILMRGI